MAPLILALKKTPVFEVSVCATGQHKEMIDPIFSFFEIVPDVDFALMGKSSGILQFVSLLSDKMDSYLEEFKPDIVLAQGDTTTVLVAALAAYYKKIPFGHVEAGLRTGDKYAPWPEEGNRRMVSAITDFHFAPTALSRDNLLKENISDANIYITGNTVVDALLLSKHKIEQSVISIPNLDVSFGNRKMVLVTGHRRENIGEAFDNIFAAIAHVAEMYPDVLFVFPVHLNPAVRNQVYTHLHNKNLSNVHLIEPLGYPEFVYLMQKSHFIITDSGGIQEEAPSLNKPVLVTRNTTERPEGVKAGAVKLIGTAKEEVIRHCVKLIENNVLYSEMASSKNPYGDGTASEKITEILHQKL